MTKWLERASVFLFVIFGLLYVGAKIDFFTRYWPLGPGAYVEEQWLFWAGMAIIGAIAYFLGWIRNRIDGPKSD
jgi:hypothetical protein